MDQLGESAEALRVMGEAESILDGRIERERQGSSLRASTASPSQRRPQRGGRLGGGEQERRAQLRRLTVALLRQAEVCFFTGQVCWWWGEWCW